MRGSRHTDSSDDGDGETLAEVVFGADFSEDTFYSTEFSFYRLGNTAYFDTPPFALMTWMQSCFTMRRNGTITSAVNGVELDDQDVDFEGNLTRKGNLILHLSENLPFAAWGKGRGNIIRL